MSMDTCSRSVQGSFQKPPIQAALSLGSPAPPVSQFAWPDPAWPCTVQLKPDVFMPTAASSQNGNGTGTTELGRLTKGRRLYLRSFAACFGESQGEEESKGAGAGPAMRPIVPGQWGYRAQHSRVRCHSRSGRKASHSTATHKWMPSAFLSIAQDLSCGSCCPVAGLPIIKTFSYLCTAAILFIQPNLNKNYLHLVLFYRCRFGELLLFQNGFSLFPCF